MKKNGQALVEFIIILPILVIILLGIIDFGIIFYTKNNLESSLDEVVEIWEDKGIEEVNGYLKKVDANIVLNILEGNDTTTIELVNDYDLITPGLNKILNSPFEIRVNRVIYNG